VALKSNARQTQEGGSIVCRTEGKGERRKGSKHIHKSNPFNLTDGVTKSLQHVGNLTGKYLHSGLSGYDTAQALVWDKGWTARVCFYAEESYFSLLQSLQTGIQRIPGALSLGVKRLRLEADSGGL
jgi:hypothetical protein